MNAQENVSLVNLKLKYAELKGEEKIITGLIVCDLLTENPAQFLTFSLELLQNAEKNVPNTQLHAKVIKAVADGYYYGDSLTKSNEYLLKAINISESIVPIDTQFLGGLCNDLGLNYYYSGVNHKARIYLTRAIEILENSVFTSELADAKSNLATLSHSEGKYEEAISLFSEVYQLDLKTGNKNSQSTSLNSLGRIYTDWGKYELGLEYYFQSTALLDTVHDKNTLGIRYNNIGMVYQLMGKHAEAIRWIEKGKIIDEIEGPSTRLAIRYFNLGNSYMALKQYSKAQAYLEKSNEFFSNTRLYPQISKIYCSLGQLFLETGQNQKAIEYLLTALKFAELGERLPEKLICYKQLYKFYKTTREFEKALQYYEKQSLAQDSIFSLQVSKQVEELEAKYQNKQKETEIIRLESENTLNLKELSFRKKERNWAIAAIFILLIFSISMYYLFSTVKRQKQVLANQNIQLDRLNQTLNRLFAIISHDLRNAMAAYQSSTKVIKYHLKNGSPENLLPLAPEIDKNAKKLSEMIENLLHWSVAQIKEITPRKELLNVNYELEKIISLYKPDADEKENEIIVTGNGTILCEPESFAIIARNLLGNSIKFTAKGKIQIEISGQANSTTLKFSDKGCGIPQKQIENIFQFSGNKIRRGTSGEKGTGLGLPLEAELVKKNAGTIGFESKEGEGTIFYITFPST